MRDKVIVENIYNHLKMFMIQSNWLDNNTPDQARALFTSLCLIGDITPDTSICDDMLLKLYNDSDIGTVDISYNDFNLYMCELLV